MHLGRVRPSPQNWAGSGLDKKIFKILFSKFCDFFIFCYTPFCLILVYILFCKNTNPVLKYLVFIKTSKKYEKKNVFVHTENVSKLKKLYCVLHTPKNNILACILALIASLLQSREHWPKFQNNKKFILFVF